MDSKYIKCKKDLKVSDGKIRKVTFYSSKRENAYFFTPSEYSIVVERGTKLLNDARERNMMAKQCK